jgi:hypothetical protein
MAPQITDMLVANAPKGFATFRVDTMSPRWDTTTGYVWSLRHNFGAYYGITMLDGYDPLVAGTDEARALWGRMAKEEKVGLRKLGVASQIVYHEGRLLIGKIENPDPMVFATMNAADRFPYRASFSGVEVTNPTAKLADSVTVNYLWRPRFEGSVDDKKVELTKDDWGRIIVPTGGAFQKISIVYSPDWATGIIVGILIFTFSLALAYRFGTLKWTRE